MLGTSEADRLISDEAHFLGMTKKDLVAEAVRVYLEIRREEIRARMREVMALLDGTNRSRLALLTGLTPEQIDAVGGIGENL
ncbi:hypothetical protein FsymDg_3766 [Candidatus Protofrankia datiscae]|uniref:Uncharacterized protein n=2 Tax=Candidatus Protofrankia datiscae TaxID=2716812 RepID=F8B521_9ACTN|nr:hypothetical protein FsymDg_3766 [Candidatus Protofrankia datiscae]